MGSELSTQHGPNAPAKRQASEPAPRSSPRPSISSDADIPYISYTVNNPIGESPKNVGPRGLLRTASTPSPRLSPKPPRPHSYSGPVIVGEGTSAAPDSLENDPDYIRLQKLPSFSPILRSSSASLKDTPDWARSQVDPRPLFDMCRSYQEMLNSCAETVALSQNQLASHMREVDIAIVSLRNQLVEKQKLFAHHCEQLGKVHDVSATLQRCRRSLTETCEMMEILNSKLPPSERLEPFVMVTG